ncbi:MAG: hypothetical protein LBJ25_03385 [Candidatus Margulisbacteria bacterium]|jgi:hypothetical protein|nr:hypothetical protein [Candidatus Margulisiibacteriota bacterium]
MTIQTGQPMLASDINNLTFFPKGAILTFSSAAWSATGAEFKKIWKVCNAANHVADPNIPDLTNKFLRGAESSGAIGGSDSGSANITLTPENLPAHNHPLTGTLTTGNESQGHTHTVTAAGTISGEGAHGHAATNVYDPGHGHSFTGHNESGGNNGICGVASGDAGRPESSRGSVESSTTGISITGGGTHAHTFAGSSVTSGGANANHTHTITLSGNTGNFGSGSTTSIPVSVNTVPAYYTVIYIIKVA